MVSHQNVRLSRGAHRSPVHGACVMELVSMLAGERFSDRPLTACPVIGAFLRAYNDLSGDADRQELLACAASVVGTRSHGAERRRVEHCVDVAIECYRALPRWRRALDGAFDVQTILDSAAGPLDRTDIDRIGYRLARLVRRGGKGGGARALAFVEELAAMDAPARVAPGPRVLAYR
jgi:hypothetical protein